MHFRFQYLSYSKKKLAPNTASATHRELATECRLPALAFGILFVAAPPRYQLPMSVNCPFCVNMAAFAPTLLTELLKLPK